MLQVVLTMVAQNTLKDQHGPELNVKSVHVRYGITVYIFLHTTEKKILLIIMKFRFKRFS